MTFGFAHSNMQCCCWIFLYMGGHADGRTQRWEQSWGFLARAVIGFQLPVEPVHPPALRAGVDWIKSFSLDPYDLLLLRNKISQPK